MRISPAAGEWAQLLLIALVAGSGIGAVWGVTRPGYVGSVRDSAFVVDEVASQTNVEFTSFGGFALITALLGFAIAIVAYARDRAGVADLVWVVACAGAAAFAVYTFGGWSAAWSAPSPHDPAPADGMRLEIVPPLSPGVGWLAGPFVAGLMFYLLNLVTQWRAVRGGDDDDPAAAAPPTPPQSPATSRQRPL